MLREIVLIDEEKCDGCGLCVPACHEGAIRIVGGKARLAAENLCDGLGACLGHCPQDAIRIEKREAIAFDEAAVADHLQAAQSPAVRPVLRAISSRHEVVAAGLAPGVVPSLPPRHEPGPIYVLPQPAANGGGCPSQRFARLGGHDSVQSLEDPPRVDTPPAPMAPQTQLRSELTQWPVQLRLLPARAPMFQNADLLLAADCAAFAFSGFHEHLLRGRVLAIACPKLDDTSSYVAKLTEIFTANRLRGITVVHMEVPCCTGILKMALEARANSGVDLPIDDVVISVRGEILQRRQIPAGQ